MEWRTNAPMHKMPSADSYSETGTRPRTAHEVLLLTATASCVIDMEDTTMASGSSGTPPALEKSPLDFDAPTAAKSMSDPDSMSYTRPQPHFELDIAQSSRKTTTEIPTENVATTEVQDMFSIESPESRKSTSFPSMDGSPGGIYQSGWGVTNNCRLDTPNTCQDMVAMGSQPRLRFEQEVRLLKKATFKIAKHDQMIQAREEDIKKLDQEIKSLGAVEAKVHGLRNQTKNLETLLEAEMDARLDKLSVDFDEELYPHMLTTIAGHRWVIEHGLHLAVMKCVESSELRQASADVVSAGLVKGMGEGLKHGIEHGKADQDLAVVEAYDPEADSKYVKAFQYLKDLKYPLVDQLERLKDAPIELIMAFLYLESDFEEDAPKEMMLEDAIAANKRWAKKKKCRVVYRTHGVGSAYHARSDGILVSMPTIAPRGLAILLVDAATQTEVTDKEDEPHPRLQRSISLPPFYNLE
nr:hypothetical protein [Tanacetum cinerariifolium]